jgi:hypothetical protein
MPRRLLAIAFFAALLPVSAAAQFASFTGVVRNSTGGALGDMTVQAYNPAGFPVTATTDSQGNYLLVVPSGTYRLVAYDNSGTWAVSFYGDALSYEASEAINVTEGQRVTANFVLSSGRSISGFVGNAATGAPLAGAVVAAYNLDGSRRTFVHTNDDGSFNLTVPAGSYKIAAYHEVAPYIPTFFRNERLFGLADTVTPPATNINFGLGLGTKLLGSVKEKVTGIPLPTMQVVAYDLQGNVQFRTDTNPAGNFAFVLPPGSFKFAVEDRGGNYQTTFFRDSTSFASAASVVADSSAPLLNFTVTRVPDATPLTTLFIPGIIHAQNSAAGTFFKTDVWIQNSADAPLTVTAVYLPGGQDNSAATGLPVVVPARGQLALTDIVQSFFGTTGAGALRLEATGAFRATSRTYNVPSNSAQIGTFGLSIPAQSLGASLGRATLAGLAHNGVSRTNIGLMNPQPIPLDVKVEVFSSTGALLGSHTFTLKPGQWEQPSVNAVVQGANFDQAYAVLSSAQGSFFSYAAVVDAKSGDGTFILPSGD